MTIAEAVAALTAEMADEGIALPLAQRFTLAATAADLCRIAGEPVPACVLGALDGPEHCPLPIPRGDLTITQILARCPHPRA